MRHRAPPTRAARAPPSSGRGPVSGDGGTGPVRVRLSRRRGWRKPVGAVVVARPSRWGNPFPIGPGRSRAATVARFEAALLAADASLGYSVADVRRTLAGRDLACWCPLDEPCHADVLLRVANEPDPDRVGHRDPDAAAEGPGPPPVPLRSVPPVPPP